MRLYINFFADSHIAILGLGGLGSHAAISLARNGIGKLTLIDFDRVEMSNLNRQQYRLVDLKYKCHALSEVIVSFNPLIDDRPADSLHRIMWLTM